MIRWLFFSFLDIALLPVWFIAAPIVSFFTADGWPKWSRLFATYDNPPQGDNGFRTKRAPFINAGSPFELYVNRVFWLWRNPGYGFARACSLEYMHDMWLDVEGNENISDKYGIPGSYFVKAMYQGKCVGFEYYLIKPYLKNKCFRMRLGYKMLTPKFMAYGYAPLVNSICLYKEYGDGSAR